MPIVREQGYCTRHAGFFGQQMRALAVGQRCRGRQSVQMLLVGKQLGVVGVVSLGSSEPCGRELARDGYSGHRDAADAPTIASKLPPTDGMPGVAGGVVPDRRHVRITRGRELARDSGISGHRGAADALTHREQARSYRWDAWRGGWGRPGLAPRALNLWEGACSRWLFRPQSCSGCTDNREQAPSHRIGDLSGKRITVLELPPACTALDDLRWPLAGKPRQARVRRPAPELPRSARVCRRGPADRTRYAPNRTPRPRRPS